MKRPFIFANMAMSLDGKVAPARGRKAVFGSREDRRRLLALRAQADAILVGARTARTDHYALGIPAASLRRARLLRGQSEYPLRCIVSGRGRLDEDIEIFRHDFSPIVIFTTDRMPPARRKRLERKATVISVGQGEIVWSRLLRVLREKFGVKKLLCEGGPTLLFALLEKHLLDELYLTFCPKIFGGQATPTLVEGEGLSLARARRVRLKGIEQVGDELFCCFRRAR